jgi:type I restriction enzyme S subunit
LFTTLEAELEAELEARRRQYAHYRDTLLTFPEGGVRWVPMGEALDMGAGRFIAAAEIVTAEDAEHPFACFGGNGVRGFVSQSSHSGSFVLIGRQGALCGNVKRTSGDFYATEHAVVTAAGPMVNIDFVYYMCEFMDLNQYATKSAQPGLAVRTLQGVPFPVPPLADQERIVAILDKFDALVNDLSVGLPAELAARRKQYEYYRDRLLTFKDSAAC